MIMDEFLTDIHISVFKEYLKHQHIDGIETKYEILTHYDQIKFTTSFGHATVVFNKKNIMELTVINDLQDKPIFYLHFLLKNLSHMLKLYNEMLDVLKSLTSEPPTRILLTCSGGMTTGYFAEKINEAVELLNLNMTADAIGYTNVYNVATDYDIILVAPQISYIRPQLQQILPEKLILEIPTKIFAAYDAASMIRIIAKELDRNTVSREEKTVYPINKYLTSKGKILSIVLIREANRSQLIYYLYDENSNVLSSNRILRKTVSEDDICDIIDTLLLDHPDILSIGISLPALFDDDTKIVKINYFYRDITINIEKIKQRYKQDIHFDNDMNTAVVGCYVTQDEYKNIVALYQPTLYKAGVGIVINGQLVKGLHNVAGEMQYMPLRLSDDVSTLSSTPEGSIELVGKEILSLISTIAPEAVYVFCKLLLDENALYNYLRGYVPEKYIPKIIISEAMIKHCILGQKLLCQEDMK